LTLKSACGTFTAMESKPAIEKFMQNCFQERTAALKRCLKIHQVFRQRFYASECTFDSRAGTVERSEAETIVDISPSDIGIGVVTTGYHINRSRYHLKSSGEGWLIHEVDMECNHCGKVGVVRGCPFCGGSGWVNREYLESLGKLKRGEKSADGVIRQRPEVLPETGLIQNPAVEQFMADHFRERSESRKKELEIHENYTKRFYNPDRDWAAQEVPTDGRQPETIEALVPTDSGLHVFTIGHHRFWLRYDLRHAGADWLIKEVDSECANCYMHGRNPDCPLCHGTIWEHRKIKAERKLRKPPGDEPPPEKPRWQP
jgi:hypothetical protein